ncbi:methionine--tRNA ligase [Camelimonas abortus]|uniref:Methionine--tRNA ligase n=1 Tax=Camelimonas abortus TaxID=1017184 RepID=A0ABV7LCL5_9HYPH
MAGRPTFYITTAISYPNGAPHIGHAYEAIATDAIARFKRLDGYDVYFQTGTDEHGLKMVQTAAREGVSPRELADRNAAAFRQMCDDLSVSYDRFFRTTDPDHYVSAQELWRRMREAGDIYMSTYSGWYSVRDEAFYDESETTLDASGTRIGPQGTPVEWTEEETWFFRLSKYQDRLLRLYEENPQFVRPESRLNEVVSFVKSGLQDLSISRSTLDWGIPVPDSPGHVMYVWVDALTNYITGVGYPDVTADRWRYWPADVHVIGKDIVRFHAVYWPAFLMSAGAPLPKQVFGHGFLFNRGVKMSKSLGNVISPADLAAAYGVDQLRYFFLREVSFGQDGSYSHEAIVNRINADLANDLGNLAQRSLSMVAKNCGGKLPQPNGFTREDEALLDMADALADRARAAMEHYALHTYLAEVWTVVAEANRYFAAQEPWKLRKTDPERMETVLYVTAEVVRNIAIMAQPAMPSAAAKLLDLLAVKPQERTFAHVGQKGRLVEHTRLPAPAPVFPRHVDPETEAAP